jgi:hypothetical protein
MNNLFLSFYAKHKPTYYVAFDETMYDCWPVIILEEFNQTEWHFVFTSLRDLRLTLDGSELC